jgi:ureidoacrylate peracid hydrolase
LLLAHVQKGPHPERPAPRKTRQGTKIGVFIPIANNGWLISRDAFHLEYFAVMLEDAVHHAGPDFVRQTAIFNIDTFFGRVSTVADFCGAVGQAGPAREAGHA